ncbi:hypothetical protein [Bifidobacterium oedipodis]|nr:hypothetical protein [Bifidobacterium sp. DSM 109957]
MTRMRAVCSKTGFHASVSWLRLLKSVAAMVCCLMFCVGFCSCSTNAASDNNKANAANDASADSNSSTADSSQDYELPGAGQKKAESLNAYIDQILSYPETSDGARAVLERAKAEGGVSISDYEQAWMNYKQCLTDRGYKQIILIKYPNGMYDEAAHAAGTDAQEQKYHEDTIACSADLGPVDLVYGVQQGNPNLFSNTNEAIVDCLKRNDLVPKDYDAKAYALDKQKELDDRSYDVYDMEVRACEVANNVLTSYPSDPIEHLY